MGGIIIKCLEFSCCLNCLALLFPSRTTETTDPYCSVAVSIVVAMMCATHLTGAHRTVHVFKGAMQTTVRGDNHICAPYLRCRITSLVSDIGNKVHVDIRRNLTSINGSKVWLPNAWVRVCLRVCSLPSGVARRDFERIDLS